jgi:uncharacterized SAM-binding protein YcdF (DUF218 family)
MAASYGIGHNMEKRGRPGRENGSEDLTMGSAGETLVDKAVRSPSGRKGALRRFAGRVYRFVRGTLALVMLCQILLVVTPAAQWLRGWLDVTTSARPADVILCLGGNDQRLIWAAELFQQGLAPVVVVSNRPGAAQVMKMKIVNMGVPAERVLVDDSSYVTADHPAAIARLPGLDPKGQRFLIVTNAEHSRRAAACFRRGGYRDFSMFAGVSSSAVIDPLHPWRGRILLLPQLAYEYAGLVQYWVQGKL